MVHDQRRELSGPHELSQLLAWCATLRLAILQEGLYYPQDGMTKNGFSRVLFKFVMRKRERREGKATSSAIELAQKSERTPNVMHGTCCELLSSVLARVPLVTTPTRFLTTWVQCSTRMICFPLPPLSDCIMSAPSSSLVHTRFIINKTHAPSLLLATFRLLQ
jgi:hypothetical protein